MLCFAATDVVCIVYALLREKLFSSFSAAAASAAYVSVHRLVHTHTPAHSASLVISTSDQLCIAPSSFSALVSLLDVATRLLSCCYCYYYREIVFSILTASLSLIQRHSLGARLLEIQRDGQTLADTDVERCCSFCSILPLSLTLSLQLRSSCGTNFSEKLFT